jgi:hypothetical protein
MIFSVDTHIILPQVATRVFPEKATEAIPAPSGRLLPRSVGAEIASCLIDWLQAR